MDNRTAFILVALAFWALGGTALYADVDLKINSAHIWDTQIIADQYARMTLSLTNLSGDDVEYVRVDVRFLTQPGNLGSSVGGVHSTLAGGYSVLRPGETGNFTLSTRFSHTNLSGTYYVHVEVSPQNGADPDTSNNSMSSDNAAHYTAPRTDGADVVIVSSGFNTFLRERNRPITGGVRYLNNSTVAAQNVTIRFYFSTDAVISESDTLLATIVKGTLNDMNEEKDSFEVPLDPKLPDGYYYGGVIISVSNDVDLSNNTGTSGRIQIGDPGAFTSGGIVVAFYPAVVRPNAAWRRVGTEKWFKHGEAEIELPPDEYMIEFLNVEGYKKPANRIVRVTLGNNAGIRATYIGPPVLKPVIEEFGVLPRVIYYGEPAWLYWKVKNTTSILITPKGAIASGRSIEPKS